jgi:enamine deaminase RidA (YjgF/YER057c/UK114 family)
VLVAENKPPYAAIARRGGLIAFGGQGNASGNLDSQLNSIAAQISGVLGEAGASLQDLVKLVAFYRPDKAHDERNLRALLSKAFEPARGVALTLVAVRELRHAQAIIEIEGYAMITESGRVIQRRHATLPGLAPPGENFCHAVRCGEFVFVSGQTARNSEGQVIFPGNLVRQNRQVLNNIDRILAALGVDRRDIVKANTWRLPPPDPGQYRAAAQDRFAYFGDAAPALTGITVPDVSADKALITIDVWAMRKPDNARIPRLSLQPENHWDWSSPTTYSQGLRCGQYLFVGGQAALDRNGAVLHPGNMKRQTRSTMEYVDKVLHAGGGSFADVIKVKTLYTGAGGAQGYRHCAEVRNRYFGSGTAASTSVPLDNLAYPHQTVEVEAIAVLPDSDPAPD